MQFIKPLDILLLHDIFSKYENIITYEDGTIQGGFGSAILEFASAHNYLSNIIVKGIPDEFVKHGKSSELKIISHLDEDSIMNTILTTL